MRQLTQLARSGAGGDERDELHRRCALFRFLASSLVPRDGGDLHVTSKLLHRGDVHTYIEEIGDEGAAQVIGCSKARLYARSRFATAPALSIASGGAAQVATNAYN